jgi:hypothetical protein
MSHQWGTEVRNKKSWCGSGPVWWCANVNVFGAPNGLANVGIDAPLLAAKWWWWWWYAEVTLACATDWELNIIFSWWDGWSLDGELPDDVEALLNVYHN